MTVCVFAASGKSLKKEYFDEAYSLGMLLAGDASVTIFGGGATGLMGACACGVKAGGGKLIGIAPRAFDENGVLFDSCDELIFTETMAERKTIMEARADAFIALPGGIGTFDELFEILTLKQLGTHDKPIVLLNTADFYKPLYLFLESCAEQGFIGEGFMNRFEMCNTPAEAIAAYRKTDASARAVMDISAYCK